MDSNKLNKIIIIIVSLIIILTIVIFLKSTNTTETAKLQLNGNSNITIRQYDKYIEFGCKIINQKGEGYHVNQDGKVDTNTPGVYTITYKLYNKENKLLSTLTRKVYVLDDDLSNTTIVLKGKATEYYFVGDYVDNGFEAYRKSTNVSNFVKINNNVDNNRVGRYTVEYYILNGSAKKNVVREVYIVDLNVTKNISKTDHIMKLYIDIPGYDYVILPNGAKNTNNNITYKYAVSNLKDEYEFDIYLKTGSHKKYIIKKEELGADKLSGRCILSYENKKTRITMQMSDMSLVSKFRVGNEDFTGSTKIINGYKSSVTVKAYNYANQVTNITCTGTPPTATPRPTATPKSTSNPSNPKETKKLEIHMISAGGYYDDAFLIRSRKATIFIDGGRGASSVINYLKSVNVNKIDYVIGSHTEYDHIDAQGEIIKNFQVSNLMYANDIRNCGCMCDNKDVSSVLSALSSKSIPITIPRVPSVINIGDMSLYIIAPFSLGCNKNDNSLVFILKYGNNTFMFTGDSDSPLNSSNKLLESANKIGLSGLKVDVLKYPHHGNEYISSSTMSLIRPSIILVPNKNLNGYPTSQMQGIISANGNGTIYRLNDSTTGSIVLTSDGNKINVDMHAVASKYAK